MSDDTNLFRHAQARIATGWRIRYEPWLNAFEVYRVGEDATSWHERPEQALTAYKAKVFDELFRS